MWSLNLQLHIFEIRFKRYNYIFFETEEVLYSSSSLQRWSSMHLRRRVATKKKKAYGPTVAGRAAFALWHGTFINQYVHVCFCCCVITGLLLQPVAYIQGALGQLRCLVRTKLTKLRGGKVRFECSSAVGSNIAEENNKKWRADGLRMHVWAAGVHAGLGSLNAAAE
jgi:hypothetical protein